MGKIQFTKEQQIILDEVAQNGWFSTRFYFTGGTALSSFYLQHRFSDDLDFLKVEDFEYLPKMIKPLTLDELKEFFRQQAKKIGRNYLE